MVFLPENPFFLVIKFFIFLSKYAFFVYPIFAAWIVWQLWLFYIRKKYISALEWVTLEVRIPKEVAKTPKAMEQVFAGVHGIRLRGNWIERNIRGRVQEWVSFELVSKGGEIHFYIHTPSKFRNLIESHLYAQYPEAEISLVDDYISDLPDFLPNEEYDLWGTEFVLEKPDAYPIRTYPYFEAVEEEQRLDPLASLFESLSILKEGEHFWIQVLARPAGEEFKKEGEAIIAKLAGKSARVEKNFLDKIIDFISGLIVPPAKKPESSQPSLVQFLTPGEREILEAIEKNIAKLGFASSIRILYISKRDVFNRSSIGPVMGAFKQFASLNLNGFRPNREAMTSVDYFKFREPKRKAKLFWAYKMRAKPKKFFVLNTEELATIYHLPGLAVRAPTVRIEAKKGEPPAHLPAV